MTEAELGKAALTPVRRWQAVGIVALAVMGHVIAQFAVVFSKPGWTLGSFRDYGTLDQLSYMGIVVNAAQGRFDAVEPFSETGSMYYPRLYYIAVGVIANAFSISPTAAWALVGLACQVVLVASLAIACMLVTKRLWVGLLAPVPFVLGTLSYVTTGSWLTQIGIQSVLWGPFAVLFPLNSEAAGLSAGGVALLALFVGFQVGKSHRRRVVLALAGSAVVGLLANVQTYSFLTTTYLLAFAVATYAIVSTRRWCVAVVSAALICVVFLTGSLVSDNVGPLATLLFGLLPAVPGLIVAAIRSRGLVIWCGLLAVAVAVPSVIGTAVGLRDGDPFLVYRVASSVNLGVPPLTGLVGSLVLTLPLGLVFLAGLHRRNALWISYPVAVGTAWVLVSTNDVWGANQEPYRLWIDSYVLIAVTLLPILLTVAQEFLPRRASAATSVGNARPNRTAGRLAVGALVVIVLFAGVSMLDWARFSRGIWASMALLTYEGPRQNAIAAASAGVGDGLVMTDPCIDPPGYKIIAGSRVVFENLGMAWGDEHEATVALGAARAQGAFDRPSAHRAGVEWVITDSACPDDWATDYSDSLRKAASSPYDIGTGAESITLWKLTD